MTQQPPAPPATTAVLTPDPAPDKPATPFDVPASKSVTSDVPPHALQIDVALATPSTLQPPPPFGDEDQIFNDDSRIVVDIPTTITPPTVKQEDNRPVSEAPPADNDVFPDELALLQADIMTDDVLNNVADVQSDLMDISPPRPDRPTADPGPVEPPSDASPADSSPADSSPADSSPADSSPADSSPAEASPADFSSADLSSARASREQPTDEAPAMRTSGPTLVASGAASIRDDPVQPNRHAKTTNNEPAPSGIQVSSNEQSSSKTPRNNYVLADKSKAPPAVTKEPSADEEIIPARESAQTTKPQDLQEPSAPAETLLVTPPVPGTSAEQVSLVAPVALGPKPVVIFQADRADMEFTSTMVTDCDNKELVKDNSQLPDEPSALLAEPVVEDPCESQAQPAVEVTTLGADSAAHAAAPSKEPVNVTTDEDGYQTSEAPATDVATPNAQAATTAEADPEKLHETLETAASEIGLLLVADVPARSTHGDKPADTDGSRAVCVGDLAATPTAATTVPGQGNDAQGGSTVRKRPREASVERAPPASPGSAGEPHVRPVKAAKVAEAAPERTHTVAAPARLECDGAAISVETDESDAVGEQSAAKQAAGIETDESDVVGVRSAAKQSAFVKADGTAPMGERSVAKPAAKGKGIDFEALKGRTFSGEIELSAPHGHRVVANIDGIELRGWVLDVDVPNGDYAKTDTAAAAGTAAEQECAVASGERKPVVKDAKAREMQAAADERQVNGDIIPSSSALPNAGVGDDPFAHLCMQPLRDTDVASRSVIVIGAGIAGVAAARVLQDRGFKVTVLEARGRLGGRIATDWSMGCPVELGACFIHGSYGNPLAKIAREADLRTYSPSDVGSLIYADGKEVTPVLDRQVEDLWKALLQRAGRVAQGALQDKGVDVPLGRLLKRLKKAAWKDLDGKANAEEVEQLLAWHAANLELACAADLGDLSAKHYDMDDRFGFSGLHEMVRDGYSPIVHALARKLDVRLNSNVKVVQSNVAVYRQDGTRPRIARNGARESTGRARASGGEVDVGEVKYLEAMGRGQKGRARWEDSEDEAATVQSSAVRVLTEDGVEYIAESCVMTVPLGVLQARDVKFDPPLPKWKTDAIDAIGFGVVNKVVLWFDTAFWVTKSGGGSGHDEEDRRGGDDERTGPDHIGRVSQDQGVFCMFLSLLRCVGAPILVAITSGSFAEHVERQTDEHVVKMAVDTLKKMYPGRGPGRVLGSAVTRWKSDKFSRGSYSYARVSSSPDDYGRMADPVGKVFFAGEATHRQHPATAHGALMSGIREAGKIIERSNLNVADKRRYARELYVLQTPHASLDGGAAGGGGGGDGSGDKRAGGDGVNGGGGSSKKSRNARKRAT